MQEILLSLRKRLVEGLYPPGSRLPLRDDLQREFQKDRTRIQEAIRQLVADGHLAVRGRLGTFVVDRPAYLHRVAVVFPGRITDAFTNDIRVRSFKTSINDAAEKAGFDVAWFTDQQIPAKDRTVQAILEDELERKRIAALIFPVEWDSTWAQELRQLAGNLPWVAPLHQYEEPTSNELPQGGMQIVYRWDQFVANAATHLKKKGCAQILIFTHDRNWTPGPTKTTRIAVEAGFAPDAVMELPLPSGAQGVILAYFELLRGAGKQIPDGLILMNQHLVKGALEAVSGPKIDDNTRIVTHALSIPAIPSPSIHYIAFRDEDMAKAAFELIAARQADKNSTDSFVMPMHESQN